MPFVCRLGLGFGLGSGLGLGLPVVLGFCWDWEGNWVLGWSCNRVGLGMTRRRGWVEAGKVPLKDHQCDWACSPTTKRNIRVARGVCISIFSNVV